jgi:chromosome segregation ATPase
MKRTFLFPELEPTAIELAALVERLEDVEAEKKAANEDFKERIELLKIQIKQAARTINEGMRDGITKVTVSGGTRVHQPSAPAGYEPIPEGETH